MSDIKARVESLRNASKFLKEVHVSKKDKAIFVYLNSNYSHDAIKTSIH